ncbi:glycosyltransferase [Ruminococcaceae bacterium OttesenSCG-928-A16]|nr:glycosyltransferase [Ruminococcaceae bacterium OttesenSCG-928-A16]
MRYDIVLVLYNSTGWLPGCIAALAGAQYNTSQLNIVLVDNASTDDTLKVAEELGQKYPVFGGYTIYQNKKNKGFGAACNFGAAQGSAPYLFFLNVDTEVEPDVFTELDKGILQNPGAGGFECRQLPYELGHHINPVTLETPWASGAAFVLPRAVFKKVGGFDPHIFMYCEDVDLSWRVWATGRPLLYLPHAVVNHYVLKRESSGTSELREYAGTQLGKLLLAYKYGSFGQVLKANKLYLQVLKNPQHFANVRKVLAKNYLKHFVKLWPFWFWRWGNRQLFKNAPAVLNQPQFAPERGREILEKRIENGPKISVVVRTCSRPQVLRQTLLSLTHQTYNNFEVIVVEDGPDTSSAMIEQEFAGLGVRYFASGTHVGRGKNGNRGLAEAAGEYLNFLDDDDYFYPDHLELMAQKAMQNPEADLILGCAMVMKVDVTSKKPYTYTTKELYPMRFDRVDIFTMCQLCQIPIQSAMFKKSLYQQRGGLQEGIEGNEDWAMWLSFLAVAKRINPKHIDIHRATSIFLLPASAQEEQQRNEKYAIYNEAFYADPSIKFTVSLQDMRGYFDDMIADMRHLQNTGEMTRYLQEQANRAKEDTRSKKQ